MITVHIGKEEGSIVIEETHEISNVDELSSLIGKHKDKKGEILEQVRAQFDD